jgi:hypothetical protein
MANQVVPSRWQDSAQAVPMILASDAEGDTCKYPRTASLGPPCSSLWAADRARKHEALEFLVKTLQANAD